MGAGREGDAHCQGHLRRRNWDQAVAGRRIALVRRGSVRISPEVRWGNRLQSLAPASGPFRNGARVPGGHVWVYDGIHCMWIRMCACVVDSIIEGSPCVAWPTPSSMSATAQRTVCCVTGAAAGLPRDKNLPPGVKIWEYCVCRWVGPAATGQRGPRCVGVEHLVRALPPPCPPSSGGGGRWPRS